MFQSWKVACATAQDSQGAEAFKRVGGKPWWGQFQHGPVRAHCVICILHCC